MKDYRQCPVCRKYVRRSDMLFTKDCHGIPFRLVCSKCHSDIMYSEKGFDGEYYTEADECLDDDY